jgi:hypothetical protein
MAFFMSRCSFLVWIALNKQMLYPGLSLADINPYSFNIEQARKCRFIRVSLILLHIVGSFLHVSGYWVAISHTNVLLCYLLDLQHYLLILEAIGDVVVIYLHVSYGLLHFRKNWTAWLKVIQTVPRCTVLNQVCMMSIFTFLYQAKMNYVSSDD